MANPDSPETTKKPRRKASRVIRWLFLTWAVVSTSWMANSFRTQGVDPTTMRGSAAVTVVETDETLEFVPSRPSRSALVFVCGSGVAAEAYAPLLRPIAEAGYGVSIVKLPLRFAPLESHKLGAIERVRKVISAHSQDLRWVIAGHSLGAALSCRVVQGGPGKIRAMVLLGTTHPKEDDLSSLTLPITKVVASNDGVAPQKKVDANKHLLPANTKWVVIEGGNHSQFGNYGHQLMDGKATVTREEQQRIARGAILERLTEWR